MENLKFVYLHTMYDKLDYERELKRDPKALVPSKVIAVGYTTQMVDGDLRIVGQFARCCYKDNFNKKIARAIIRGRYEKYGPGFFLDWIPGHTAEDTIQEAFHPDYGHLLD